MSPAFRKQYESLVDDFYEQMIETIAADRKLDAKQVRSLIDTGLFTATAAKAAGLIDTIAYGDEIEEQIEGSLKTKDINLVKKLCQEESRYRLLGHAGHDQANGIDDGRRTGGAQQQQSEDRRSFMPSARS